MCCAPVLSLASSFWILPLVSVLTHFSLITRVWLVMLAVQSHSKLDIINPTKCSDILCGLPCAHAVPCGVQTASSSSCFLFFVFSLQHLVACHVLEHAQFVPAGCFGLFGFAHGGGIKSSDKNDATQTEGALPQQRLVFWLSCYSTCARYKPVHCMVFSCYGMLYLHVM
jgi:hypothetical protein